MTAERRSEPTGLGDFLRARSDELVALWTERVREFSPAKNVSNLAIVDHLPQIIERLALAVSSDERVTLTQGPRAHAVDRLARGFDLREVVREYTILRHTILDLWERHVGTTIDVHEVRQLHGAIDAAVEESAARFASARERVLKALDRISEAALGTDDLDEFLRRLLEATRETSDAVDSAVVLLRHGDWLRVRAAAGLEGDRDRSVFVKVGDGFAGGIASTKSPAFVRDAGSGIRALYGVPLIHRGECIGVTHIGSATAHEFSEEDKLLFRTMASRATGVIVQTELVHDLAQRELEFRALADNIAQLAWMADETGYVFWYNKRWLEYTGALLDGMRSSGFQSLSDAEHGPRVVERFRRAVERGERWEDTFPLRGKDGNFRWFLSHAVPIKDVTGRVIRWFGTHTDVTEQREIELELRAAETSLRLATEATRLGTWDLNLVTGEARWSPHMQRIFGIEFQPEVGWTLDVVHPEDRDAVRSMLARSYAPSGDGNFALEYRVRSETGELRWVDSRGRTFFDEQRRPIRMVGTTLDVTARKRAEIAAQFLSDTTAVLASSLDYQRTLAEACRLAVPRFADWAAVTLVESDGRLTDVTVCHTDPSKTELVRRMLRQYPHRADAGAGLPAVIRTGRPELVPHISDELLNHIAPDAEWQRIIRELGFKAYLVVPMIARERVLGAITFASAETARAFDEMDLETARHLGRRAALAVDNARLYEEARAATRVREQVLAIVSHDLRSPLAAIQLASNILATKLPEASEQGVHRNVRSIRRAAERMEHLISDLLDVASIQAGRLSVEPQRLVAGKLLDETVASHEAAAAQKGVTLRHEGSGPAVTLEVDPDRVLQVLSNLIGNAIKFSSKGDSVLVRAELDGNQMLFSVRDTGPGITADELPHLFEPYWSAAQHASKGTGLGLYISRGIVEAHGGHIWAESAAGAGSTFFFTLPVASAPAAA